MSLVTGLGKKSQAMSQIDQEVELVGLEFLPRLPILYADLGSVRQTDGYALHGGSALHRG